MIQSHARILSAVQTRSPNLTEKCRGEHLAKAEHEARQLEEITDRQPRGEEELFPGSARSL